MSAIGSYEILKRSEFANCFELARNIRTETTGKWFLKNTRVSGRTEFLEAWRASILKQVDFDYSGYVLGQYLDAQLEINQARLFDEDSEPARILGSVFTAIFVFEEPLTLPELPVDKLQAFCRDEYGEEGPEIIEPFKAAHNFYARGLKEITPENLVVFVIR
jgi:hypothetical protein